MAGPIHGLIECFFNGVSQLTGSVNVAFINVYNFLNNNTGTLGIKLIASNTGSTNTGAPTIRGMNYYDSPNPAGDNAWACFAFQSASNPFYVLIQYTGTNAAFGSAPGSPGLFNGAAGTSELGFAFAQRADGGNPWNGSSGSNPGADTKGTPVWHPGTSSLALCPRSNDGVRGGSHGTNRQNTFGYAIGSSTTYRQQLVADFDNFCMLHDATNTNVYSALIFGPYTPLSGVNSVVPYYGIKDVIPFTNNTAYGTPAGTDSGGGISFPVISVSGNCSVGIDRYNANFFQNTNAQPNRAFPTNHYDEMPLIVGIFESPNQIGMTGQSYVFYREVFNTTSQDTNGDGTRACFGSNTQNSVKLTIPWASGTVPGSGLTRGGFSF